MVVVNVHTNTHKIKAKLRFQALWSPQAPPEGSKGKEAFKVQIELDSSNPDHAEAIRVIQDEELKATQGQTPTQPILTEISTIHPVDGTVVGTGVYKMTIKNSHRPLVVKGEISKDAVLNSVVPTVIAKEKMPEDIEVLFQLYAYEFAGKKGLSSRLITVGLL